MENEYVIIQCPHCKDYITVYLKEYNCKIFRHGVFKDRLFNEKLIYGCGKPFRIVGEGKNIKVEICDYIWLKVINIISFNLFIFYYCIIRNKE